MHYNVIVFLHLINNQLDSFFSFFIKILPKEKVNNKPPIVNIIIDKPLSGKCKPIKIANNDK